MRGTVLPRVYELEELKLFLTNEGRDDAKLLANDEWCARLAYMAAIFHHLNELNTRMQGQNESLLPNTRCTSGNIWKMVTLRHFRSPRIGKRLMLLLCVRQ